MNGLMYHRLCKGLTQRALADQAGVSIVTVTTFENNKHPHTRYTDKYLKLSDALNVPIDDLLRQDYSDDILQNQKKAGFSSKTENLHNCIAVYRHVNRLTFEALGQRLGNKTKQCSQKACAAERPYLTHVNALAEYEHISVDAFIAKYTTIEEKAS